MNFFVISLDRNPQRFATFKKVNPHLKDVRLFKAIDGAAESRESLIDKNIILSDNKFNAGALGCALSHMHLWKYALENNEAITVFEDDAFIHKDFLETSNQFLKKLNHFYDYIAWGWNFDADLWVSTIPFISPILMQFNQNSLRTHKNPYLVSKFESIALRLFFSCGTLGYTVSPGGARRLLELCVPFPSEISVRIPSGRQLQFPGWGVDLCIAKAHAVSNNYACFPPLVISDNDHATSNIQKV